MSLRTPRQERALTWYCKTNGLIPQLSAHPEYRFRDRQGNESERSITHILADYDKAKEEEKNQERKR